MPFVALPGVFLDVVIRAAVPPAEIAAAARSQLRALDPGLALSQVSTMDRILDDSVAKPRFQAVLLALFAAVALSLAAIGVYGVTAQGVRSRTAEFGVRMALGARALDVFLLVERQGLRAPLLGLAVGLAAGWASGHLLNTFLYGVTSHDPLAMAGAAAFILVVGLVGCGLPAFQASRTDSARALRDE
jgi:ABC-type antimicrobial peptide transport system permease subunit